MLIEIFVALLSPLEKREGDQCDLQRSDFAHAPVSSLDNQWKEQCQWAKNLLDFNKVPTA